MYVFSAAQSTGADKGCRMNNLLKRIMWCLSWAADYNREFWRVLPVPIVLMVVSLTLVPWKIWEAHVGLVGMGVVLLYTNHIIPLRKAWRQYKRQCSQC